MGFLDRKLFHIKGEHFMTKIYDQHTAAFRQVSAFVILRHGERVATIAFKSPKDGAGRLYAYIHWFGTQMVRGYASGYGYDKKSAAAEAASHLLGQMGIKDRESKLEFDRFLDALRDVGGNTWDTALRNAGFTVFMAV
jgi:hypothetical protein